jgi:hypothetical protein
VSIVPSGISRIERSAARTMLMNRASGKSERAASRRLVAAAAKVGRPFGDA